MERWVLIFLCLGFARSEEEPYYGEFVGELSKLHHDVRGKVYAVDNLTIYLKDFYYDGEAPDAYFFAGNKESTPSSRGFIIPNEKFRNDVLGPYKNSNLILRFPVTRKGQRSFSDIQWISVWCKQFGIDFGHVKIPKNLKLPKKVKSEGLRSDVPFLTSSSVTLEDTATIRVSGFNYDGSVPDAIFVMGSGATNASGVQVPDETGSLAPLKIYKNKELLLSIPKEVRGLPVQYFGVWSPTLGVITSTTFPTDVHVPPALSSLP
ncbi:protein Skeletor, isoforms B/C-like [Oratosquilla oratoria]|uniref:protein Skeletor, isoforms B/C-like n=1 Tax=Oratosquilla oratoria TaxID=337810 RepID=UPI003F7609E4